LGYQLSGEVPPRIGNGHIRKVPHGAYPSKGDDKWIAISVGSDEQWTDFQDAIGNPDWAADERFSTLEGRLKYRADLDGHMADWTRDRNAYDVMRLLQHAGIAAGVVVNAEELMNDAHLNERGFYWKFEHPEAGVQTHAGQPIRLSRTPARHYRPAPTLGQHHPYVLGELLGLSDDEITELEEIGIIGYTPLVRER
jgi:crotonobetainyl-CoA:carnitine CoA-transferase CaiB-like acyl-CoA transferase